MQFAIRARDISEKINFRKGLATSWNLIGGVHSNFGEYEYAVKAYRKSAKIREEMGDKNGLAASYNNIGDVYLHQGNYTEALKILLPCLQIYESTNNQIGTASTFNGMGIIYYSQQNYKKALESFFQSIKRRDTVLDKHGLSIAYNNIGLVFYSQGNYKEALKNYSKSLKLRLEIGDKRGASSSFDNIGSIYYEQRNYEKAIEFHLNSLEISKELGFKHGISLAYINLGKVYMMQGNFNQSEATLRKALGLANQMGEKDVLKEIYFHLTNLYSKKLDYKQAYIHQKLYSAIKDSIFSEQSNKQMAEMNIKYETEKKDRELLKLTKDNEVKQIELKRKEVERRNLLIIVVASILVVLILILLGLILKRSNTKMKNINTILVKQSEEIEQKNREINTQAVQIARYQSQMNPHFIFNAINGLQSMVLEEDKFKAIEQIQSLSKLLRLTLNNSESEYITISEEENYLNKYVEFELLRFKKKFKFKFAVNEDVDRALLIPTMIIQPMIENAIKHAGLNDINNGEIAVRIYSLKNNTENLLGIEITDNGTGVKVNTGGHESKGLKITKQRLLLELRKNNIYIEEYLSIRNRIYDENDIINGTRVQIICPCYNA